MKIRARQQFADAEHKTIDQLIKNNQELTELCKIAQDYAGHVSHQIRTPLTVIKSYAAILANNIAGQLNMKQIEHLTKIVDQTDSLNNMLTSMLEKATISAPQKGRFDTPEFGEKVKFKSVNDQSSLAQPARLDPPSDTEQTKREDDVPSSDVEETSSPQTVSHSKGTVLIVDDDPNITDVFTVLIGNLGFNVICASNGRECLAKFTMHDIDVMILDLAIAGDDGLNIYQKVLNYEFSERDNTPAILLTGSANEDIITRSSNVGAHYVLKNGDAWENVQRGLTDLFKLNSENSDLQEPVSEYAISA